MAVSGFNRCSQITKGQVCNLPFRAQIVFLRYVLRLSRLLQPAQHILRAQRQFVDAHAGGVEDRVGDAGHGRDAGDFRCAFGSAVTVISTNKGSAT